MIFSSYLLVLPVEIKRLLNFLFLVYSSDINMNYHGTDRVKNNTNVYFVAASKHNTEANL